MPGTFLQTINVYRNDLKSLSFLCIRSCVFSQSIKSVKSGDINKNVSKQYCTLESIVMSKFICMYISTFSFVIVGMCTMFCPYILI